MALELCIQLGTCTLEGAEETKMKQRLKRKARSCKRRNEGTTKLSQVYFPHSFWSTWARKKGAVKDQQASLLLGNLGCVAR